MAGKATINNGATNQVKSRQRVANHGEVFTSEREVNAMLDLVKQETERIDSRFLEPACGHGNFLAEILTRKLAVVDKRYRKCQLDYERNAVIAVSSIYGIDILEDNVQSARERLFLIFDEQYTRFYKDKCKDECRTSVRFILGRNILWGDALALKTADNTNMPIVFSEWSTVNGSMIKRRDFTFSELLQHEELKQSFLFPDLERKKAKQLSLFSDLGDDVFLPTPKEEYPLIHFLELGKNAE